MKYFSKKTDQESLVYETTQGLYFDALNGYSFYNKSYERNYKDSQGVYHSFSYVYWEQNEIVLPQCLTVSRATVKYVIHPHPRGSAVGDADYYFGTSHNLPVIAVGVNNNRVTWYKYPNIKTVYELTLSELYRMINQ